MRSGACRAAPAFPAPKHSACRLQTRTPLENPRPSAASPRTSANRKRLAHAGHFDLLQARIGGRRIARSKRRFSLWSFYWASYSSTKGKSTEALAVNLFLLRKSRVLKRLKLCRRGRALPNVDPT